MNKELINRVYINIERLNIYIDSLEVVNNEINDSLYIKIIDELDQINRVIHITDSIGGKYKGEKMMLENLNEIMNAFINSDFILVRDLFKYEIKPLLREISDNFVEYEIELKEI